MQALSFSKVAFELQNLFNNLENEGDLVRNETHDRIMCFKCSKKFLNVSDFAIHARLSCPIWQKVPKIQETEYYDEEYLDEDFHFDDYSPKVEVKVEQIDQDFEIREKENDSNEVNNECNAKVVISDIVKKKIIKKINDKQEEEKQKLEKKKEIQKANKKLLKNGTQKDFKNKRRRTGIHQPLCSICGKTFTKLFNLKNHMQTHTDDYMHCNFCGYKNKMRILMIAHMKNHHMTKNHVSQLLIIN